jgi:hypothetical protein
VDNPIAFVADGREYDGGPVGKLNSEISDLARRLTERGIGQVALTQCSALRIQRMSCRSRIGYAGKTRRLKLPFRIGSGASELSNKRDAPECDAAPFHPASRRVL